MKILIVDDSRVMRSIERKILQALGPADFVEAADGVEALAAINTAAGPIDLALVDCNMPNMDGVTLVRRVRETNRALPLIMVTTESEKDCVIEATRAGANNYVVKPFTPEGLLAKVRQTLGAIPAAA